jgi:hypothetical protein
MRSRRMVRAPRCSCLHCLRIYPLGLGWFLDVDPVVIRHGNSTVWRLRHARQYVEGSCALWVPRA